MEIDQEENSHQVSIKDHSLGPPVQCENITLQMIVQSLLISEKLSFHCNIILYDKIIESVVFVD